MPLYPENVFYINSFKRHANFKSATNAMILLMRIVTGEDWNKIMVNVSELSRFLLLIFFFFLNKARLHDCSTSMYKGKELLGFRLWKFPRCFTLFLFVLHYNHVHRSEPTSCHHYGEFLFILFE